MKRERIVLLKEFLTTQANHWAVFPLAVMALGLTAGEPPRLLWWLGISLLPFLFYLIRRYTDHILIFAVSHGAAAAGVFYLSKASGQGKEQQGLFLLFAFGYAVYSCAVRLRGGTRQDDGVNPVIAVGISAVMVFFQRSQGCQGWDVYYILALVFFLGFYVMSFYIEQYLRFLCVNESSAGRIPEREIFRSGAGLAGIYTAAGMLLLLLTANLEWLAGLLEPVRRVMAWLLRLLLRGGVSAEPPVNIPDTPQLTTPDALPEAGEPGIIWKLLEWLVMAAAVVVAAGAVAVGVIALVRFLRDRFRSRVASESSRLDSVKDVRESCGIERGAGRSGRLFTGLNPEAKIRGLYRKRVLADKGRLLGDADEAGGSSGRLEVMTARECGRRLGAAEMARLYEKARYSGVPCTRGEVKAMRRCCRLDQEQ